MIKPILSGDRLLRRYQNPVGMNLHGAALLVVVVALWTHRPGLIALVLLVEAAAWFPNMTRRRNGSNRSSTWNACSSTCRNPGRNWP